MTGPTGRTYSDMEKHLIWAVHYAHELAEGKAEIRDEMVRQALESVVSRWDR